MPVFGSAQWLLPSNQPHTPNLVPLTPADHVHLSNSISNLPPLASHTKSGTVVANFIMAIVLGNVCNAISPAAHGCVPPPQHNLSPTCYNPCSSNSNLSSWKQVSNFSCDDAILGPGNTVDQMTSLFSSTSVCNTPADILEHCEGLEELLQVDGADDCLPPPGDVGGTLGSSVSETNPSLCSPNGNKDFNNYVDVNPNIGPLTKNHDLPVINSSKSVAIIPAPTLLCTNVRSAFPKADSITTEILEEGIDLAFLTEIWMDSSNPLHSNKLERLFEVHGLESATTPRRGRRGGGVAIILNTAGNYTMKRLQVNVATGRNSLETIWVLVTSKVPGGKYKHYICCCVYSPPNSRINDALVHHLQFNL